jgi:hypothetical protein
VSVQWLAHAGGVGWDEILWMLPVPLLISVLLVIGARKQRGREAAEATGEGPPEAGGVDEGGGSGQVPR